VLTGRKEGLCGEVGEGGGDTYHQLHPPESTNDNISDLEGVDIEKVRWREGRAGEQSPFHSHYRKPQKVTKTCNKTQHCSITQCVRRMEERTDEVVGLRGSRRGR
jgi:hypothetical protein